MSRRTSEFQDRLYAKAVRIREGEEIGTWLPKMQLLAHAGHTDAMIDLADWYSFTPSALGSPSDAYSAAGLYRRAFLKGNCRAARNLAMTYFNRNDMANYRVWLRKAANGGDADSQRDLERFNNRYWHGDAAKIRRLRPRKDWE